LKKIDALPGGPEWTCEIFEIIGDIKKSESSNDDEEEKDAAYMAEEAELWRRDPVECVKELISNPAFRDLIRYAPEQLYERPDQTNQVFDEMWTGEWWWDLQVLHSGQLQLDNVLIEILEALTTWSNCRTGDPSIR
jgi:hypothetical protein